MLSDELYDVIRWMMNSDWQQRPSVEALLRYPRIANLLTKRKRWWSSTRLVGFILFFKKFFAIFVDFAVFLFQRKLRRKAVEQFSNKWYRLKKMLLILMTRMSFAVLSCIRRRHKNEYEEHNSMSPLEVSDDDHQTSTPNLGDSSINMSEVVNSTPILSHEKSKRRQTRLVNAGSPQINSSFEEFEDHLSRSPLNYTPRSTHEYSSLTCKKLFMHTDDSDSDGSDKHF